MEPTLKITTRVKVSSAPNTLGAIVLFHPPAGADQERCGPKPHTVRAGGAACDAPFPHADQGVDFIKRIVAGPGDEIFIKGGHVYRRARGSWGFSREPDGYARACGSGGGTPCDFPQPITIPAGDWFLMGDNRGESDDSRLWGPVPAAWIVGVVHVVWRPRF